MAGDAHKKVFISYRRAGSGGWARAIYQDLQAHGYDVFLDIESIDSGKFDTIILNQIAANPHFVLILTPGSADRFGEPGDWLRREIEHAMDLKRNIVPVLFDGFKFEDHKAHLTGKLAELPRYNALDVPHGYFDAAMDKLRTRFLKQPVEGALRPTPAEEQPEVARKKARAEALVQMDALAERHLEAGRLEEAVDTIRRIVELNPPDVDAYRELLQQIESAAGS